MKQEYIEILVEEPSMKAFLESILPGILPEGYVLNQNCFVRPHEGKSHLQKSIPKKAVAYKHFEWPVKMVVVHDQDSNDCKKLKKKLVDLVRGKNEDIPMLIRIACKELENWYLGDLSAVESLYPDSKATRFKGKARFRHPDNLNGSDEMAKLSSDFSKMNCARSIAEYMNISENKSESFKQFISGFSKILKEQ